jgi:NADH:ubiquinone oxidoreductase subunit 2 (subunit N)
VIVAMYFWSPAKDFTPTKVNPALGFALTVAALGTLYFGLFPSGLLFYAKTAADSLTLR